jgi:transcriptional regulator with XRE-family HTH domain
MTTEAHPIDIHVGQNIRKRRVSLGISQSELASYLGITFQQVQKYETGKNRIGASRLYEMSVMLDTTVSFFFKDLPRNYNKRRLCDDNDNYDCDENEVMNREALDLVKAYRKILDPNLRKKMLDTIKYIATTFDFEVEDTKEEELN